MGLNGVFRKDLMGELINKKRPQEKVTRNKKCAVKDLLPTNNCSQRGSQSNHLNRNVHGHFSRREKE